MSIRPAARGSNRMYSARMWPVRPGSSGPLNGSARWREGCGQLRALGERLAESFLEGRVAALLDQCVDCVGSQSLVQRVKDSLLAQ